MQCGYYGSFGRCGQEAVFEFRNQGDASGEVYVGACSDHLGRMLDPSRATTVHPVGCGWAAESGFAGQPVRYGNMTVRN